VAEVRFQLVRQLADAVSHHRYISDPPARHQQVERRLGRGMISRIVEQYKDGTSTSNTCRSLPHGKGSLLRVLPDEVGGPRFSQ